MSDIIIYNTPDGKASVALMTKDGNVWMNQMQLAELFATSKQNIGQHIKSILEDNELSENSVVKNYFTTAADGKDYEVAFYALDMILAIGFRVRSKRGNLTTVFSNHIKQNALGSTWQNGRRSYLQPYRCSQTFFRMTTFKGEQPDGTAYLEVAELQPLKIKANTLSIMA
jgi:hypothetical protein